MRQRWWLVSLIALMSISPIAVHAQFRDDGLNLGVKVGGIFSKTEKGQGASGYDARGFFRHKIAPYVRGELGIEFGELKTRSFKTEVFPLDYRFLFSPYVGQQWCPYFYAGIGVLYYEQEKHPANGVASRKSGRAGFVPAGVGAQFMVDNRIALEISGGYTFGFVDGITSLTLLRKANFWNTMIGVSVSGADEDPDPDKDGLLTKEERRIKTDPYNPDTDGDGLTDGEEVRRYKTDPLNPDTDGDGLRDGEEVKTYTTDPNNPDTDGDRLIDGAEVLTHKTDPLNPDTDGDRLTDGDEVLTYKTNPLNIDTDAGTIDDGAEVRRGTDPLNPADDIPKTEELAIEVGKAIVLEGVVFEFNKSTIKPESEQVLTKAYNTMKDNPGIEVEIHGHTDNKGKASYNLKLSQARANSVKQWLVNKGIDPARIGTRGFGFVRPIATNDTDEGRQKNRRIEFVRVK